MEGGNAEQKGTATEILVTRLKMGQMLKEAVNYIPEQKIYSQLQLHNMNHDSAAGALTDPALTLLSEIAIPILPHGSVSTVSIPISTFEQLVPSSTPGPLSPRTYLWGRRKEGQYDEYEIGLIKIQVGQDTRTTLMMKNIPNEYNYQMLVAEINKTHRGSYDWVHLPFDNDTNRNKGCGFINLVSPFHVISLYQEFNGKKWEGCKKVVSLVYAKIQGKAEMVRRGLRPKFFDSKGRETGDQGTSAS